MKFSQFEYTRPDQKTCCKRFEDLIANLKEAKDPASFYEIFLQIDALKCEIFSQMALSLIRHSINTADPFYDKENDYWDEAAPFYEAFDARVSSIALNCPFKEGLYAYIPKIYFDLAQCQVDCFDEKVIPLLQKENAYASEYERLKASAQIEFEGKIYNLSTISPFLEDVDRDVRKRAYEAKASFYEKNEAEFDRIYDQLVKVRDQIAKELGYKSFTEVGYKRMKRIDYNADMVKNYRKQVREDLVPLVCDMNKKQAERLKIDKVYYYDEGVEFLEGNPKPQGSAQEMIRSAGQMYHELSPQTGEFIDIMMEQELWDLISRDNKELGGYSISIDSFKVPFIFSNFNGTSGDVDVLTHEAGHAFQYYLSRNIPLSDLRWGTNESSEIFSMSMEFFTWPWSKLFFADDDRYHFLHLSSCIRFMPYGVLIDHFQHEVYDHPEWSPQMRKECYHNLEKLYQPYLDYGDNALWNKGCWWYQQGHVFSDPFYYIDYTLAQVCALQFWARMQKDDKSAWEDYLHIASLGGTLSFTQFCEEGNLKNPFLDGCLKEVKEEAVRFLQK